MTQALDATGTYGFIYDNMNRLTEADTTYTFLSGLRAVKYGYDAASNRNSMTDPQTVPITYGYDVLNRLSSLTYNGQSPNYTFGYDTLSRRTSQTRPNGIDRGAEATTERAQGVELRPYCGCMTSSTTTLPPLSAVMTLCTGAYPLRVMSST
jgi:YD repeat-containing protein